MFAKFAIATATAALLAIAVGQSANAQVLPQKGPTGVPGSTSVQAPSAPTSSTSMNQVPRPTSGTMQAPAPRPAPTPAPAPAPAPRPTVDTQSLPMKR